MEENKNMEDLVSELEDLYIKERQGVPLFNKNKKMKIKKEITSKRNEINRLFKEQKMGKNAQLAINNMLKEAGKYDIFNPRKINHALPAKVKPEDFNWGKYMQHKLRQGKAPSLEELKYNFPKHLEKNSASNEKLTALDKDLSNMTTSQLNQLAKKQQKQMEKEMKNIDKIKKTASQFGPLLEKKAKAGALTTFDDTVSRLLSMSKSNPDRAKLMKQVDKMAPEVMANNPKATPAFLKLRDSLVKTSEAESKSQQRLMGMVHAYQNGELDMAKLDQDLQYKIRSIAKTMNKSETKEYAETKHKKLPEKKASFFSTISKMAPKLTRKLDKTVQNQRHRFIQKAEYAKKSGNPERASRFEYKANKVDKDLASAREARKPVDKIKNLETENAKLKQQIEKAPTAPKSAPEPKIKEVEKVVEKKKPMKGSTKALLGAAGVTGMAGAGAVGYNMGQN